MRNKYSIALMAVAVIVAVGFTIVTWQNGGSQSTLLFAIASIVIGIGGVLLQRPSQALKMPINIVWLALVVFGLGWFLLQVSNSSYFSSLQDAYQQADQGK